MDTRGKRLREAREAAGLTQGELAEIADVHEKTVSKWENDKQRPHANQLGRIAPRVNRSIAWLLALEENPNGTVADPVGAAVVTNPLPRVLRTQRVRVWLSEFRHELTKAGASDERIQEAMDLLTAPQVFSYYRGGAPGELSEEEAIVAMEAIAKFIRQTVKKRRAAS